MKMNRIWTHVTQDEDGYTIRKHLSKREAQHFAERNGLTVIATGQKPKTERQLYKEAFDSVGPCLL